MKPNRKTRPKVNREARDKLVDIINRYLNEQIGAFQFDEEMHQLRGQMGHKNRDRTVEEVTFVLWTFYDDIKDHLVHADKMHWDLFQRLILLLKSDAHLEIEWKKTWSLRQLAAALTLGLCITAALPFGIGEHLYFMIIPCGIVSLSLTAFWKCEPLPGSAEYLARVPFNSFAQLRSVRRTVPDFVKQKFPKHLASRIGTVHSRLANAFHEVQGCLAQFFFSPIVLFFQMFPKSYKEPSVLTATDL